MEDPITGIVVYSKEATKMNGYHSQGGEKYWFKDGVLHRENGPARIKADGTEEWYLYGKKHRGGGEPAYISKKEGTRSWWENGIRHRVGGPAFISDKAGETWWQHGLRHRTDGPAVINTSSSHRYEKYDKIQYWVGGHRAKSQIEFQLMSGISDEDLSMLILKYGEIGKNDTED